jgi:hypothetical protein
MADDLILGDDIRISDGNAVVNIKHYSGNGLITYGSFDRDAVEALYTWLGRWLASKEEGDVA